MHNINIATEIISYLLGYDAMSHKVKIFADIRATNRNEEIFYDRLPYNTNDSYVYNCNLIPISRLQLQYELTQWLDDIKLLETLLTDLERCAEKYNNYNIPLKYIISCSDTEITNAHTGYYNNNNQIFYKFSKQYNSILAIRKGVLLSLIYDKDYGTLYYKVDTPSKAMMIKIKQHLIKIENTKDGFIEHDIQELYVIDNYRCLENEAKMLPSPYIDSLINLLYKHYLDEEFLQINSGAYKAKLYLQSGAYTNSKDDNIDIKNAREFDIDIKHLADIIYLIAGYINSETELQNARSSYLKICNVLESKTDAITTTSGGDGYLRLETKWYEKYNNAEKEELLFKITDDRKDFKTVFIIMKHKDVINMFLKITPYGIDKISYLEMALEPIIEEASKTQLKYNGDNLEEVLAAIMQGKQTKSEINTQTQKVNTLWKSKTN